MDFTREPIIETIITPKEGCKLVVRASKNSGQEEYFVDSLEVVSFGSALFFRSSEKPKSFLLPVSDYEVLEVREARMVLKNVGLDRSIKIGGGREGTFKAKEQQQQQARQHVQEPKELQDSEEVVEAAPIAAEAQTEARPEGVRLDKKRERRRHYRRRRSREDATAENPEESAEPASTELAPQIEGEDKPLLIPETAEPIPTFSNLLAPPPTLISETLSKYRENALFKGAFYTRDEKNAEDEEAQGQEEQPDLYFHEAVQSSAEEACQEACPVEDPFTSSDTEDGPPEEPIVETLADNPVQPEEEEEREGTPKALWDFSEEDSEKKTQH